jgi:Fe-S cluster assembly protein SufD
MTTLGEILENNTIPSFSENLKEIQKDAFASFQKMGIPSTRHEEWKYTNIKTALSKELKLTTQAKKSTLDKYNKFEQIKANKLVFVNGFFDTDQSEIIAQEGLTIGSLKEYNNSGNESFQQYFGKAIDNTSENFAALNTAFAQDGAFIHLKKNTLLEFPVFIIHLYTADVAEIFVQSRNLIIAEQGSAIQLVEDFQNQSSSYFGNHVSEVFAAANANVECTTLQLQNQGATAINFIEAELEKDAVFQCNTFTFEGKLIRNNVHAVLKGENAEACLNGLFFGKESNLIDNHILIDHTVPNCNSYQIYKGMLDDESTGVFNGKIFVKKDAQKTNAYQSSKAILISEGASMNSKPQLEIFADDVKCSHGAAIGQISKNEIFYFKSRGISEQEAQNILTYAFANEVIGKVKFAELRTYLDNELKERLKIDF